MIKIKVPATSANLGVGFDTLGVALNIYNTFYIEESEVLSIEGVDKEYQNRNNLFMIAFDRVNEKLNTYKNIKLKVEANIPIARGLGSSASLIVAGALAANHLSNNKLTMEEVFQICTAIEGHPDNIAPALFGGFTTSFRHEGIPYVKKIAVHRKYRFTLLVPDFEVSTSQARAVLPSAYSKEEAVSNLSNIVSLCLSLSDGDDNILKLSNNDKIHEPYRKKLIPDFDLLKEECLNKGAYTFMISGSGSACLTISDDDNFSEKIDISKTKNNWEAIDCKIHDHAAEVEEL
ncbi:MAG TPA: homoserine kinase [Erysipelotrichaceae bacterium]|nr:homoserine kinase [Erysipelotrichaceae bacterium]